MSNNFDNKRPIYQQIIDRILTSIAKGEMAPGEKVASVRVMALYYGVNPNTIQKSLAKLEEMGYLRAERTSGRYVTSDAATIAALKTRIPDTIIGDFVAEMIGLGIAKPEIPHHVKEYIERVDKDGKDIAN
ncbi:MAG: GntR family transcriptional regulator [Defluviitaleaceae bacterium]|nr:GntR family transcriptional regulator [Defluviitaleaceae bacterium]